MLQNFVYAFSIAGVSCLLLGTLMLGRRSFQR